MNLPDFIAKRTINSKTGEFSGSIYKIAISSVAIGLAIMLVSILILGGFKQQISNKIYRFTGHLQVTKYTLNNSFEDSPTSKNTDFYKNWRKIDYIGHIQSFAYKAGLIKANETVEGVIIKGLSQDFDSLGFKESLKEGSFPNWEESDSYSTEILVSRHMADLLQLTLNDKVLMYFVQNPPRYRQLKVVGIYETGLEEFDQRIIIGDLRMIQRLNGWDEDQVGGYEIFLKDQRKVDFAKDDLFDKVAQDQFIASSKDKFNQYFEWLDLLNQNVRVFLGLILFVACFNMAAVLFILIMERTNMIGLLKAIGTSNKTIRKIFYYSGLRLTIKGLLYGNLIAIGLAFIQDVFRIIPLDAENYYMSFVPILWDFKNIIFMNLMVLVLVGMALTIPTVLVTRLRPIKAIRFD